MDGTERRFYYQGEMKENVNVGEQNELFERMGDSIEARLMSMFRNRSSLWVGKTETELVEECEGKNRRKLPSRKVMLRRAWRKIAERQ